MVSVHLLKIMTPFRQSENIYCALGLGLELELELGTFSIKCIFEQVL